VLKRRASEQPAMAKRQQSRRSPLHISEFDDSRGQRQIVAQTRLIRTDQVVNAKLHN
jgi:hypothetical protein